MSHPTPPNAFYAQSGGVTSVINATAASVIEATRQHPEHIGTLYAGKNGILGALHENLIDTAPLSALDLKRLSQTPGGVFGSCRYKLKDFKTHQVQYHRLIDVFKAHNIRYFFYNGGNDSQDTALKVAQISQTLGYPITTIGIPKTIDNDLMGTDNCPGFGSVAKYVNISLMEAALDVASMSATSTKVFILEVMGRHTGWIAASSGLAKHSNAAPPHLILMPEVPFEENAFLDKVKQTVNDIGYAAIVVSEGVKNKHGDFLSEAGTQDAFGHKQLGGAAPVIATLIQKKLGLKYHYAIADYLQRSARHIASQVDLDQAKTVGQHAVAFALNGQNAVMPAIKRLSNTPYRWKVEAASLETIANLEKMLPPSFITEDGFGITPEAQAYFAPLIQGEAYPDYKKGVPDYLNVDLKTVEKRLAPYD